MKYAKTHPWINFSKELNITSKYSPLWHLLGQVASKLNHLKQTPVAPNVHEELNKIYLIKGVLATTAIEGNTLTEDQVEDIVEKRSTLPPSIQYQGQEIQNILDACNDIILHLNDYELTPELISRFNAQVLCGLELEEGIVAGEIRHYSVSVANYRGAPAEDCPHLMRMLCDWLSSEMFSPPPSLPIQTELNVIRAVLAHLYFVWIHPFGDGNGRTARLLELFLLLKAGFPIAAAHLLSNHYNNTRHEYYRNLARLTRPSPSGALPPLDSFLTYAAEGLRDGLQNQLGHILSYQIESTWRNMVHESLRTSTPNKTARRRRELLLSMKPNRYISRIEDLSTALYHQFYRNSTSRILIRDLNHLAALGLVEKKPEGYRPHVEIVQGMLPYTPNR